jgi:predicted ATPase/DNA-binding SARP family transcriptional activator
MEQPIHSRHPVRFAILGALAVRAGEHEVSLGGPRQLALLAYLLLHANRAVSSEQLHDALWGAQDTGGALKRVQMAIARLRRSLEPLELEARAGPMLRTVSGGYVLAVADGELDAQVFQDGLTHGRALNDAGHPGAAADVLRDALALWRGPPLADVAFEDFAQAEIRRLEELRLEALEARIAAELALGRHRAVLGELQTLMAEHPARERFCEQLMLALYRSGRQTEALEAFHRLSSYLDRELGLRPGPALQTLQRAVLEQAAWLDGDAAQPTPRDPVPTPRGRQSFALPSAVQSAVHGPFVGRAPALGRLEEALERAATGTRQVVLLQGEPGVGKTRLACEFARVAHTAGAVVLYGRCDEESLLPHQPFVEALRQYVRNCPASMLANQVGLISGELRRVVPELAERVPELPHPLPGDPEGARHRLFEAVSALLCETAQQRSVVLLLDDLHWADAATLLLLKYIARYPRAARLMIVGTYRETDVGGQHPLTGVLADLTREQLVERLALGRLDEGAVFELVGWHTGNRATTDVHRMIFEETDGLPFFVLEFARHLSEWTPTPTSARLALPEGVRDLVCSRLSHLGSETTRVLETASVVGQAFSFELLERLCNASQDDLVDALDRAVRAQLVREPATGDGRYGFSHALIRHVLYDTLTVTRRRLLHRRVAAAIEEAGASQDEGGYAELAHHLGHAGGSEDLERAIGYAVLAGDHALALLAYEQAAAHYRRAIEMLDRRGAPAFEAQRCELMIAQGEAERMAGDPAHRETLLRAATLARAIDDPARLARAALANNRGFNSSSQGVDRERVAVLESALTALDEADSATRAGLLAQLAVELIGHDDWQRRAQLAGDALAMARRVGDPRTLARVLTQVAVAQVKPGTTAMRADQLREAWELATRTGERLLAAQATNFAINAALDVGEIARAREQLERLEGLSAELGQPMIEWYVTNAHAKLLTLAGSPKDAEPIAFAAYELGRRAGQPDAFVFLLAHLYVVRLLQGTLATGDPNLVELFAVPGSSPPVGPEFEPIRSIPLMVGAAASAINCEIGRLEDGRAHFDLLMSQIDDLPHDYSTLAILASASIACGHLRDPDDARALHDALAPFAGQFVNNGATGPQWLGFVDHHLGVLCAAMGRADGADAHFAAAERAYERMGNPAWLTRCRLDWAAVLLEGGDIERARDLLDKVVAIARELGLSVVEQRAAELAAARTR